MERSHQLVGEKGDSKGRFLNGMGVVVMIVIKQHPNNVDKHRLKRLEALLKTQRLFRCC
jgi:hypothetical protein